MLLTVAKECGRCGKQTNMDISLDDAQQLADNNKLREDLNESLTEFAKEIDPELGPDIIVMVKKADGVYAVRHLSNLCTSANGDEKKRNRGCLPRVDTLLNDVFMLRADASSDKPKKKRAPKKSKAVAEAAPEVD